MVFLSGQLVWVPLVGIFLGLAYRRLDKKCFYLFLLFLLLTIVASDVTSSYVLKNVVSRLRPCKDEEIRTLIYLFGQKCGGRFGFVSSHAANAMALVLFPLLSLKMTAKKYLPILLIPFVVGYSRIYLGVHYPGDILGGIVIGSFWSGVFSFFFQQRSWRQSR
jgi:undecaprenyl-diphosphatase